MALATSAVGEAAARGCLAPEYRRGRDGVNEKDINLSLSIYIYDMYVCMCVCMYVCMYIFIYVYISA